MADHNELGKKGEELVAKYQRDSGYKILERNRRFGKDEIDIIARDGDFPVIAEVKTRRTNNFRDPEEFVSRKSRVSLYVGLMLISRKRRSTSKPASTF